MIHPAHLYCWFGYLAWVIAIVAYLADYVANMTYLQTLLLCLGGMLVIWLLLSRLVRGTSLDNFPEPDDNLEIPQ